MSITATLWRKHWILERNSILLLLGILIVIAIGGLVEVVPLFYLKSTIETAPGMRPYTPLELAGRNVYVREALSLADDPRAARRGRALRALLARSREPVRPTVPVGLQAQRTGPGTCRRQIFRRLASRPSEGSAFGGARLDHAGLPLAVHQRA